MFFFLFFQPQDEQPERFVGLGLPLRPKCPEWPTLLDELPEIVPILSDPL